MRPVNSTTTIEPDRHVSAQTAALVLLIEVPELEVASGASWSWDRLARWDRPVSPRAGRSHGRLTPCPVRRRRLRREVVTACRLILGLAAILSTGLLWGGKQASNSTLRSDLAAPLDVAAREIEAIVAPTPAEPYPSQVASSLRVPPRGKPRRKPTPVVFPGYLLPDDAVEAPGHEGG